jgi:hypothetical protein
MHYTSMYLDRAITLVAAITLAAQVSKGLHGILVAQCNLNDYTNTGKLVIHDDNPVQLR